MISAEALSALAGLEHGARYNSIHTVARELRDLGYAYDDWGTLAMSELGRRFLRRGKFHIAVTSDEGVHDMSASVHMMQIPEGASIDRTPKQWWRNRMQERASGAVINDPMASPQHVYNRHPVNDCQDEQTVTPSLPVQLLPEEPPTPLPVATSRMQEMLRAAGVASGITGTWVDAAWLTEFVRALDEGGVFSEAKNEDENTPCVG